MARLLAGDTLIDETDPLRILWVDRAETGRATRDAIAAEAAFFQVRECHTLAEGIEAVGRGRYDVVVLSTDLPDAWPSDIFPRFVEKAPDSPVLLIVEEGSDGAMLKNAERRPFCTVERVRADPTTMRRLVISAGILIRTLGGLPQSYNDTGPAMI